MNGAGPIAIDAAEALVITVNFACPAQPAKQVYTATAVALDAAQNPVLRIPISATVQAEALNIAITTAPGTFLAGQVQNFQFVFESTHRSDITGFFKLDSPNPPFSSLDPDPMFPAVPAMGSLNVTVPVVCAGDAALGDYTLSFAYREIGGPTEWGSVTSGVQVVAPQPPPQPDPRKDHFDAVWVEGSTHRICQLTGGGDPEGLPHPNDTTRFGLLGTDLGSSFDHFENGEHRTYFFFGDTHTNAGDQDGDAIAYTTDDQPEPEGLHLQFIMGDNQWRAPGDSRHFAGEFRSAYRRLQPCRPHPRVCDHRGF